MKLLLLLALLPIPLFSMEIQKQNLFVPVSIGKIRLFKTDEGFIVQEKGAMVPVESHRVDITLRTMNKKKLATFLHAGYLSVNKNNDNNYSIQSHGRMRGGGIFGAWLGSTIGYGADTFAGYGAIHLASACTGPLYAATFATLTQMYAIPIHTAATTAGIALGVTTAVATGPV